MPSEYENYKWQMRYAIFFLFSLSLSFHSLLFSFACAFVNWHYYLYVHLHSKLSYNLIVFAEDASQLFLRNIIITTTKNTRLNKLKRTSITEQTIYTGKKHAKNYLECFSWVNRKHYYNTTAWANIQLFFYFLDISKPPGFTVHLSP